ncbi:hypothetical protein [Paraburkholderia acidipaludis]|uniref:hypothetical protein n=1 Tax=Paraburkholderia acidipaludis TaxID=660537 RepID=UPI0012EC5DD1|nr:hypothetical protein [Paraburkholderia acidipaludis]
MPEAEDFVGGFSEPPSLSMYDFRTQPPVVLSISNALDLNAVRWTDGNKSKADLLQFIGWWAEARNIERFLSEVETDLPKLDPVIREHLAEGHQSPWKLLGEGSALDHPKCWKTPQERLID